MNQLKEDERELVKLANYFKKKASVLIEEGKLSQEHEQVIIACEKLTKTIYDHSSLRDEIIQKRENIKNSVKDNAICPECQSNAQLKFVSVTKNDKGWSFNKYKCRKCNIQFVWNKPNNPWDMIYFMEDLMVEIHNRIEHETTSPVEKEESHSMLYQLNENLNLIKPIIQKCDQEYQEMQHRDSEIESMIKNFKNYLLIQKVLLDSSN